MANEKRLIDANALKEKLQGHHDFFVDGCGGFRYLTPKDKARVDEIDNCIAEIVNAPTVDAVEVVHGYWIDSYSTDHMGRIIEHSIDCSVCESVFKDDSREVVKHWKERFEVCPFCGAKMDGGNEDA